jgi:hypothetical protein
MRLSIKNVIIQFGRFGSMAKTEIFSPAVARPVPGQETQQEKPVRPRESMVRRKLTKRVKSGESEVVRKAGTSAHGGKHFRLPAGWVCVGRGFPPVGGEVRLNGHATSTSSGGTVSACSLR